MAQSTELVWNSDLIGLCRRQIRRGRHSRLIVIYDERFSSRVRVLERDLNAILIPVAGLERTKRLKEFERIVGLMIKAGVDRRGLVLALGGGVVGDLAGFVASTYMRGLAWMNVPTTLVAMVDSSYGGKTAVNHKLLKNVIGTFHPPKLVAVDVTFLKTLPVRDMISGAGELLKYGLLFDRRFFYRLTPQEVRRWRKSPQRALPWVKKALRWKALTVKKDPLETNGVRRMLNLGHTMGHALEASTGYRFYRHGEAIILGLDFAVRMSRLQGMITSLEETQILKHLRQFSLPRPTKALDYRELWAFMKRDKKSQAGVVKMVLIAKKPKRDQTVSSAESLLALIGLAGDWKLRLK